MIRLKIVKDADEYTLPIDFAIQDDYVDIRKSVKDKVFSHGAFDLSDGKIKEKTLLIKGIVYGATRSAYLTALQELREKLYQQEYKLYFGEVATYNYYYNIEKVLRMKDKYIEGNDYVASETEILLLLTDPFLYYKTVTSDEIVIGSSPKSWTIKNSLNGDVVPRMTSNTAPSPYIITSSGGTDEWKMFDNDTETHGNLSLFPMWLKIDLGSGNEEAVTKMRLMNLIGWGAKNFTAAGSNDNLGWTNISSELAENTADWQEFSFTNTTSYRYYRITFADTYAGIDTIVIKEIELIATAEIECAETFPIITITADKSIKNLILQNESDVPAGESVGLKFSHSSVYFVSGNDLVIDCQEGTVTRETSNSIRYFSGAFLKLLPGDNEIKYTGDTDGATTVKFVFSRRLL